MSESPPRLVAKAIWAQARDEFGRPVIGRDGDMPWHVPEDLAYFSKRTRGHVVIMGRRTWESLPPNYRPLPGRQNIVVTSRPEIDGAATASSLAGALALAATDAPGEVAWIMGGAQLYTEAVNVVDEVHITEIDLETPGDTFAPTLDPERWYLADEGVWETSSTGPRYRFTVYRARVHGTLSTP